MSILEQHADKWTPEPNTGCLIWTGAVAGNAKDRPQISVKRKMVVLSPILCEEEHGPRPTEAHLALHNTINGCIGGLCVNNKHMRWGTQKENMQDISPENRSDRVRRGWNVRRMGQSTWL